MNQSPDVKNNELTSEATSGPQLVQSQSINSIALDRNKRLTRKRLSELATALLGQEIEYISDRRYQQKNAAKEFENNEFDTYLRNLEMEIRPNDDSSSLEMSSCMGQAPLLTPENEACFFSQMNYLKFRFNQLRSKIDPENPDRKLILEAQAKLNKAISIRDLIIRSNLRLVMSITRKFVTPLMSFDDLFSDGVMALMQAVEKFDIGRGYRFSTYGYYSISRSMYRFTKRLRKKMLSVESFELNSESDKTGDSILPEQSWSTLSNQLSDMVTQLDEREQWIIRQRYSFDGLGKAPTYKQLAEKLGVCNERVRQLEKRALLKLRNMQETLVIDDLLEVAMR
ncbi:sigma-70 family RNA polymerase sigma factor [Rubinisphaera italica]|uniref:RNA polymerase sigma factor SigA n=1 Tax=Rubinisphaera italica TaxID=2527969 RepID=A0A5C5XAY6_9PLAN|nr:sigma-70 family RNA polymerase sigma factor [Rubinisphaera italica]TWT59561.1 RNA polymerase sigma factor SigA [Rubinisphaera italica]